MRQYSPQRHRVRMVRQAHSLAQCIGEDNIVIGSEYGDNAAVRG